MISKQVIKLTYTYEKFFNSKSELMLKKMFNMKKFTQL